MAAITEVFDEVVKFARITERLMAAMATCATVSEALLRCAELDPDLHPELGRAGELLGELLAAIEEASQFAVTRFDVAMEKATERLAEGD